MKLMNKDNIQKELENIEIDIPDEGTFLEYNGVVTIINSIYKDFDSRICKNCQHYGEYEYEIPGAEDFTGSRIGCTIMKYPFSKEFGCIIFALKDSLRAED